MKINIRLLATFILFIFFIHFTNGTSFQNDPLKPGTVTILGQIKEYNDKNSTARLTYRDLLTGRNNQEIVYIEFNGNFKLTFDLRHSLSNSFFQYDKVRFQMHLVPGETYSITINQDGTHVFSGKNGEFNNQILESTANLRTKFKKDADRIGAYFRENNTDYPLFERLCNDLETNKLSFVNDLFKKKKISFEVNDLLKKEIKYEHACYLLIYRRVWSNGRTTKRIGLPSDYFNQIFTRFPVNDPNSIQADRYNDYIVNILNSFWDDFQESKEIIDYFKETKKYNDRQLFLISKYFLRDTSITNSIGFSQFFVNRENEIKIIRNRYLASILLRSLDKFQPGIGRDILISQGIYEVFFKDPVFSPTKEEWNQIDAVISNKLVLANLNSIDQYNQAISKKTFNTDNTDNQNNRP